MSGLDRLEGCTCYECTKHDVDPETGTSILLLRPIVCPLCGNRRCPKATNHRLLCSGSDEPNQEGSRYQWIIPEGLGVSSDPDYKQPPPQPLPDA